MNKTNQLQPLIEADVAQYYNNTQSTHQATTENSVARVVKILHARYFPLLSADDLLRDVDAKIDAWIVEVIATGLLEADTQKTQTFITNLKALAKDRNDHWDCVYTEAGQEFCRMWVVIPSVIAALKDHDRFINPGVTPDQREKLYKERLIDLYNVLARVSVETFCNTGKRNDIVKVLHRRYKLHEDEVVFIMTAAVKDIADMIVDFYREKLESYLKSEDPSQRQLGLPILRQWLQDEVGKLPADSGLELRTFRQDGIAPFKAKVEKFILEYRLKDKDLQKARAALTANFNFLDDQNCPVITIQTTAFLVLRELIQEPKKYPAALQEKIFACQELQEVERLYAAVRRTQLLEKVLKYVGILPIGSFEGHVNQLAVNIYTEISSPLIINDTALLCATISRCDQELSDAIHDLQTKDTNHMLDDSFACLVGCGKRNDFRKLLNSLLQRPEYRISEPDLRTLCNKLTTEEEGQTILNLTPSSANSILWHAMRVSPAHWSADFQYVLNLMLTEMRKEGHDRNTTLWRRSSYPQKFLDQIDWLLECAGTKLWTAPPQELFLPCNLEGLKRAPKIVYTRWNMIAPLNQKGWWLGVPDDFVLADVPDLTPEVVRDIWNNWCLPTQCKQEIYRDLPNILTKRWDITFYFAAIPNTPDPLLPFNVLLDHWHLIAMPALTKVLTSCKGIAAFDQHRLEAKITDSAHLPLLPLIMNLYPTEEEQKACLLRKLAIAKTTAEVRALQRAFVDLSFFPILVEHYMTLEEGEDSGLLLEAVDANLRDEAEDIIITIRFRKFYEVMPDGELPYLESMILEKTKSLILALKVVPAAKIETLASQYLIRYLKNHGNIVVLFQNISDRSIQRRLLLQHWNYISVADLVNLYSEAGITWIKTDPKFLELLEKKINEPFEFRILLKLFPSEIEQQAFLKKSLSHITQPEELLSLNKALSRSKCYQWTYFSILMKYSLVLNKNYPIESFSDTFELKDRECAEEIIALYRFKQFYRSSSKVPPGLREKIEQKPRMFLVVLQAVPRPYCLDLATQFLTEKTIVLYEEIFNVMRKNLGSKIPESFIKRCQALIDKTDWQPIKKRLASLHILILTSPAGPGPRSFANPQQDHENSYVMSLFKFIQPAVNAGHPYAYTNKLIELLTIQLQKGNTFDRLKRQLLAFITVQKLTRKDSLSELILEILGHKYGGKVGAFFSNGDSKTDSQYSAETIFQANENQTEKPSRRVP